MNSMKKVILPVVMSIFMVFTMMPAEAFADNTYGINITAYGEAKTVEEDSVSNVDYGVNAVAMYDGGEATATVKKDVSSDFGSIDAESYDGGTTTVNVGGDVTSTDGVGVTANTDGGTTTVNVGGNVTSKNQTGVYIQAYHNGEVTVDVGGIVTSESEGAKPKPGMEIHNSYNSEDKSKVTVTTGDVTSAKENGLVVKPWGGETDILVDGTIKGNVNGISVQGDPEAKKWATLI